MFFFEYIIKLLIGNSNSLFAGLIVFLFGYCGWLIWNINERTKDFGQDWEEHKDCLTNLKNKIDKLDESVYRELIQKLNENINEMEKMSISIDESKNAVERYRSDIISEIKESADETKEIMKILINSRSRSIKTMDDNENNDRLNYPG